MRRVLILIAAMALASCSGSSTAPSPAPSAPAPLPPIVMLPPVLPLPVRGAQFSQIFWDMFVHDSFDAPTAHVALQRLAAAPMLYLKTVDEAGHAIDAVTLQTVEDAMTGAAMTWGGGQFGLRGVERGAATREGVSGWITVAWPNPSNSDSTCGRAQVAVDGGWIELNYLRPGGCSCGSASKIYARLARHELGHAFGYWHTDSGSDVMYGQTLTTALDCNLQPSAREIYHATLAYQSPIGTTDRLSTRPVIID